MITASKSTWLGRSLANYIQAHKITAEKKGVLVPFLAAKTLSQARKILFGYKKKNTR